MAEVVYEPPVEEPVIEAPAEPVHNCGTELDEFVKNNEVATKSILRCSCGWHYLGTQSIYRWMWQRVSAPTA